MYQTNNIRVLDVKPLLSPDELKAELPITDRAAEVVYDAREAVRAVIHGRDTRLLALVGPCSIHDVRAALEYAGRLRAMAERHRNELLVVMRVYFEKPRTTVGWKGLINDPHLDGTFDIPTGLRLARRLLLDVADLGLPAATELLDTIVPQYIADLVSWAAIGARTTESQTHREMTSGVSMPVGFKNGTDGSLGIALNAMLAASSSHHFLGIDGAGRVSVLRTAGNPDGHLVLRGGAGGPNYDEASIRAAAAELSRVGVNPRMIVDCSHDNSGKNHEKQHEVLSSVAHQLRSGSRNILGVMVESNLVAGSQKLIERKRLEYGKSITDGCVDFATTESMLDELADAVRASRHAR